MGGCALTIRAFAITTVAALAAAAADPGPPTRTMPELRIDAAGFDAAEADIRAVVESAGRELWRHFPDHRLEPLVVVRGEAGPITLYDRNERREVVIRLDTGGRLWCQYAYQFAHEFCHVLCGSRPGDRTTLWFEETLCETASLYAIRGMARTWRTEPPYPHWREYRDSLRDYADDAMRRWPHVEEITRIGLPAFHVRHETQLRANPVDRELNGSMAVVLLRSFEETPEHWEAVRWLNERKTEAPRTFDAMLADWHESVPEKHRGFVARLAGLFGRAIRSPSP